MNGYRNSAPARNPMVRSYAGPAGPGPRPEMVRPNPSVRNDRPPNAYGGQTFGERRPNEPARTAEPPRGTESRPSTEAARPTSNERPVRGSTQQQKKNTKKTERQ
jgi:hypothetical protein